MSGRHSIPGHDCPNCGERFRARPYDIGSGPEVACPRCECCFGAQGQSLQPLPPLTAQSLDAIGAPVPDWLRNGEHVGTLHFDYPPQ